MLGVLIAPPAAMLVQVAFRGRESFISTKERVARLEAMVYRRTPVAA